MCIELRTNDPTIIKQVYNVKPDDMISEVELRNRLQLNTLRECVQKKSSILVVWNEWKRVPGSVNVRNFSLMLV